MDYQGMSPEEYEMYEKLYELQGAKVKIGCDRIYYQGIISTILPTMRTVTLRRTYVEDVFNGNDLHFRFKEIKSLSVVESREVVNRYPRNDYLLDILQNKSRKKYDIYADRLYDSSDEEEEETKDVDEAQNEQLQEEEFALELPLHLKNRLPKEYIVIDSMDKKFTEAIQQIFKETVVGASFDGPKVSRFGQLTSICICTTSHVYLFDIEILKVEAFDNGLRDLFEDPHIKKVIHDCRFSSDCLYHLYSTKLANVFDTQVADFVVAMQCYNDKYDFRYVSSLDSCIRNQLNVLPEFRYPRVKGLSDAEKKANFTKRPMSHEFRYDLMNDALYLILLHDALAKRLLKPLHRNVDAYLKVLAGCSSQQLSEYGKEASPPDKIPLSILMNGIQTARFREPKDISQDLLECSLKDLKTGQIIKPMAERKKTLGTCTSLEKKTEANKENCVAQIKPQHQVNNLSKTTVTKVSSSQKVTFETVVSMTVGPSMRDMDEVYHKLANSINPSSQSAMFAKPLSNYVSRITVRMPFSNNNASNIQDSSSHIASSETDSVKSCNSENELDALHNSSIGSDFWANLNASADVSSEMPLSRNGRKIAFVPG